jgi:hypothetical protein
LDSAYSDVRAMNYPGLQSNSCYPASAIKNAFERITGEGLVMDEGSSTFGRFRLMYSNTASRLTIHTDSQSDWTGLIYLNTPEQCKGGTAFYRHKATGLRGLPSTGDALRNGELLEDLEARTVGRDTQNLHAWDVVMFVAMRFNRLILFRGYQFHSHTCAWGDSPTTGRLTQNFFFNSSVACGNSSTAVDN